MPWRQSVFLFGALACFLGPGLAASFLRGCIFLGNLTLGIGFVLLSLTLTGHAVISGDGPHCFLGLTLGSLYYAF